MSENSSQWLDRAPFILLGSQLTLWQGSHHDFSGQRAGLEIARELGRRTLNWNLGMGIKSRSLSHLDVES